MGGFFERQTHLTQAIHTLVQGPALRGVYIIFQNSPFPDSKAQLLFPSACPKTLLIPEWGQ